MRIISVRPGSNWKGNYRGNDEHEVHDHKDSLQLAHNFAHNRSENAVQQDTCQKSCVDLYTVKALVVMDFDSISQLLHQE